MISKDTLVRAGWASCALGFALAMPGFLTVNVADDPPLDPDAPIVDTSKDVVMMPTPELERWKAPQLHQPPRPAAQFSKRDLSRYRAAMDPAAIQLAKQQLPEHYDAAKLDALKEEVDKQTEP